MKNLGREIWTVDSYIGISVVQCAMTAMSKCEVSIWKVWEIEPALNITIGPCMGLQHHRCFAQNAFDCTKSKIISQLAG